MKSLVAYAILSISNMLSLKVIPIYSKVCLSEHVKVRMIRQDLTINKKLNKDQSAFKWI